MSLPMEAPTQGWCATEAPMPVGEATRELRVAVIEDDRSTRKGLELLLGSTPGYTCAGAWGSVEESLAIARGAQPEILLLDVRLPGVHGPEAIPRLRERWPETLIVMLTSMEDESVVLEALSNGAVGYILKRTPPARLLDAIAETANGGSPMSPEIARRVVGLFQRGGVIGAAARGGASGSASSASSGAASDAARGRPVAELSPQERRLLALLAEGHSYLSAAGELEISVNTVRKHIRNLYEKLQVHTRSEAVGKAMRGRLI